MIFGIKEKMNNFDPYNVFLLMYFIIAINIPQYKLLYTMYVAFIIYLFYCSFFALLLVISFLLLFETSLLVFCEFLIVLFRLVLLFLRYWQWWQELLNFYCITHINIIKTLFKAKITIALYISLLWNKMTQIVIWDFGHITHPYLSI